MLLRASRSAETLTKCGVGIAGTVISKGLAAAGRNWKPILGTGVVGAAVGPQIAQSMQKGKMGTNPRYIQAQQAGMAPRLKPGSLMRQGVRG